MDIESDIWLGRFLKLAKEVSTYSKDPSTKTGAYIFSRTGKPLSFGYNGPVRKMDDSRTDIHERPKKLYYYEHAERNAIYNAEVNLKDAVMFCTHFPCADCTRAIIQNGITTIVIDEEHGPGKNTGFSERWQESMEASLDMLNSTGVKIIEYRS